MQKGTNQQKIQKNANVKKNIKQNKTRKKKNYNRYILIGVLLVVAIVVGVLAFLNSDRVIDEDSDIITSENSELLSSVKADAKGFPVTFTSNDIIEVKSFSSRIFVLTKKLLTCVSSSGSVVYSKIISNFTEPAMTVSDNYGVIYDRASSKFIIFTDKGVIFEGEAENKKHIITAKVNNHGEVAFVTKSDNSACRVYLINKKGETLYIWSCADEYAVSLDLTENGEEILCGTIGSDSGEIYTKLYLLNIYSDKEKAEFLLEGSALVDVSLSGRKIIAVCNEGRFVFDSKESGSAPIKAEYSSDIVGYNSDKSGNTAIITNKIGSFGTNEITVYNKNNEITYRGHTDENIVDVLCRGKKVYILTGEKLLKSLSDGTFESVTDKEIKAEGMAVCKSRMYYHSTGQINLIG